MSWRIKTHQFGGSTLHCSRFIIAVSVEVGQCHHPYNLHVGWLHTHWQETEWQTCHQCKKLGKYLHAWCTTYFWALQSFKMCTGPLFQIKLHLLCFVLLNGFQSSPGALKSIEYGSTRWIQMSDGHSKYNCLQDRVNFHRSWAWQIVLIFKTVSEFNSLSPGRCGCDFQCVNFKHNLEIDIVINIRK